MAKRVDALINSRLPMLKRQNLHLSGEKVTDVELAAVLADDRVPSVRILDVGDNQLTAAAVETILGSSKTTELHWLVLSNNPIGDKGVQALASSDRLKSVTFLGLVAVKASERSVQLLAQSRLHAIETLQIGWQTIGDSGARALAKLPPLGKIDLMHGQITATGARTLLSTTQATHLILAENPIGPGGLGKLTKLSSRLHSVDLSNTGLAAEDVAVLAGLPIALENLNLAHCDIGDEGLGHLAQAPWLGRLQSLDVGSTGTTPVGRKQLRETWGQRSGLTIERDP